MLPGPHCKKRYKIYKKHNLTKTDAFLQICLEQKNLLNLFSLSEDLMKKTEDGKLLFKTAELKTRVYFSRSAKNTFKFMNFPISKNSPLLLSGLFHK